MPSHTFDRDFVFLLSDVARLFRTRADQGARHLGMSRAQWAVLARIERAEGLKQSELAEVLDLQPITLTRLIDRLCESGLIERRNDINDRRAKRLFLLPAARPVLDRLRAVGDDIFAGVLAGTDRAALEQTAAQLAIMRDNLRLEIAKGPTSDLEHEQRYG